GVRVGVDPVAEVEKGRVLGEVGGGEGGVADEIQLATRIDGGEWRGVAAEGRPRGGVEVGVGALRARGGTAQRNESEGAQDKANSHSLPHGRLCPPAEI